MDGRRRKTAKSHVSARFSFVPLFRLLFLAEKVIFGKSEDSMAKNRDFTDRFYKNQDGTFRRVRTSSETREKTVKTLKRLPKGANVSNGG